MTAVQGEATPPFQPLPIIQDGPLDPTLTALSTLSLLSLRLSRLEHLLTGSSSSYRQDEQRPSHLTALRNTTPIPTQIRQLETRLQNLKRLDGLPGNLVRMIDSLRREFPEIFPTSPRTHLQPEESDLRKHDLSIQASEVLANSTLYTTSSAHLQTLQTLRIPPAEHSAKLLNGAPRLQQLKERQAKLDEEIEELKGRSAGVIEWWVKNGVVGMGELWEDWEARVRVSERAVRRAEWKRREEMGELG